MVRTMASSPRREREEERRHNVRTLVIASIASASAAAVTSQLWIAGTWVAAAVTPILVTLVSEALGRPTERIARAWTSDRPAVRETAREPVRVPDTKPSPRWPGLDGPPDDGAPPRPGEPGPVRVYRGAGRRPRRRKIAFGAVAATAALSFVIGIVLLTGTELIAGQSIGKGGGRTSIGIGGGGKNKTESDRKEQDNRSPADIGERPQGQRQQQQNPSTQPQEESPQTTTTTPTPTTPEQTTTQPTPAPQQAPAPPPSETAPAP
jgi:hypothetical protein